MCELQTLKDLSEPGAPVSELSPLRSPSWLWTCHGGTSEEVPSEAGAPVGALPLGSGEGFWAYCSHPRRAPIRCCSHMGRVGAGSGFPCGGLEWQAYADVGRGP